MINSIIELESEEILADKFKITGGETLRGEVSIGGAKNAVLKLLAATILVKGSTKIYNVPKLTDVEIMLNVISDLGASCIYDKEEKSVVVNATNISSIIGKSSFLYGYNSM